MSTSKLTAADRTDNRLYDWPRLESETLPDGDPTVFIAFNGLMALTYDQLGFVEVGIHNNAAKHEFSIKVYEGFGSDEPMFARNFGPASTCPVDVIRFDISDPLLTGVKAFTPPSKSDDPVDREFEDLDLRWITDFESLDFYDRRLQKKRDLFRPRMHLRHGIFVTLSSTSESKIFKREAPNDPHILGRVATIIGALVYLEPDGFIAVRIGTEQLRLEAKDNRTYIVYVENSCAKQECKFEPASTVKEKRNDFYEYYQMFHIPDDKEEYELVLTNPDVESERPVDDVKHAERGTLRFRNVRDFLESLLKRRANDEAPCGPGSFGGGGS
jgi:hypothetical protein